ncbi:uncharacterized protein (DUF2236 family) [Endobacter medicaginis]|uniref:Uncharacterized protein (DUF2236 family) n=4 Tax=Endobacter medicaginis TaxID=1181271 RepID=A0A839UX40_9PROT|nr:oxygenase MpaB family protein [Endobacter medicaginis]MBB3172934.1 uncharacterized protein (DUF2236 family) [Endobacter medicaginis]MCX5474858.1 oxygenase MpaB family protein [Endobacter medicaginis]
MTPPDRLAGTPRDAIARRVSELFTDPDRPDPPVRRSSEALFAPDSMAWRVHGDVGAMMVGGIASLLMQMLHPAVLAGVWDHSAFRENMQGRLRSTARFIARTTYAARPEAEAAIARVRAIHERVCGTLPDGTPYRASDPALLAWVHVTETSCFVEAWRRHVAPGATLAEQNRYLDEMARIGLALGAAPVPRSRREAQALMASTRPQLRVDDRTVEVARLLREQPGGNLPGPIRGLLMQAALDLLPGWAQAMHARTPLRPPRPLVRLAATGAASTLRWALR